MTSKTTRRPSSVIDRVARRSRVVDDLEAFDGLRDLLVRLNFWDDLEAEIDRCVPPLYVSPYPSPAVVGRHGLYFDVAEVERFLRFCSGLRHTKGSRWGGRPLIPDLWQILYIVAPVFGIRQADGNRYHRECFLEVPRKNGKSTLASAITLYLLLADSNLKVGRMFEPGAEIYAAATTTAQALFVFQPAEAMARRSIYAERLSILSGKALSVDATLSKYEVISGDPAKAEDKMGGNVSGAVVDEIHVHKDRRLIDTIETGTPGREQPLIFLLTTAGQDTDGTIYDEKHELAVAIGKGEIAEVRTWAVVYAISDDMVDLWDHRDVWEAANPGLGISVSEEYLVDQATKAKRSEAKRRAFLRLHLNMRTDNVFRWIDLDALSASEAFVPPLFVEMRERVGYAGLDLSSSTDLSALAVVCPRWDRDPVDPSFEIEVLDVILRAWTPRGVLPSRPPRDRALFEKWIDTPNTIGPGPVLIGCEGMTIDYDAIEAAAYELADWLSLDRLSFDRWGSKQIVGHLRAGDLNVVEIGQGFAGISPAMKETERIILERRLRSGANPLLRYSFSNLIAEEDAAGNIKPNRRRSSGHIDPAVAVIMAVDGYARENYGASVYEERGMSSA